MKKFKPPRLKDITLLLVGVLCIASPISAVMARKNIEVLTGVEIFVDGIQVHPVDANGNRVETFIYQGTTYIPARAVSEYLGYAVNWDGQNQRVYIGEMPGEKQYLLNICPPYMTDRYEAPATFEMAGDTYTNGFILANHGGYAIFNLDGKYDILEFDLGYVEGSKVECKVNIYLDGNIVQTIKQGAEDLPEHITVPINGVLQLKIENMNSGNTGQYGFGNVTIY